MANFHPVDLPGDPARKTALLINSPVYDTQYWAEWSQPYGLLRIARLLEKLGYKRRELFDFMEAPGEKRTVARRRIAPGESFVEKTPPTPGRCLTGSRRTARRWSCGSIISAKAETSSTPGWMRAASRPLIRPMRCGSA